MRRVLSAVAGVSALLLAGLVVLRAGKQPPSRSPRSRSHRRLRGVDVRRAGSSTTDLRPSLNHNANTAFDPGVVASFVKAIRERGPNALIFGERGGRLSARGTALASTSVLVLLLLLSLGTIGVVHGLWSKNLTVEGVVATGDLNADWDKILTEDRCGQTNEADITVSISGTTAQANATGGSYGGGYGDQDGGADDPCPLDPCADGGHSYRTSGTTYGGSGGEDPCPPDPCDDGGHSYRASETTYGGGGGEDPCPPDPCDDGGHSYWASETTYGGGAEDPCPPDSCDDGGHSFRASETTYGGGGGEDPCPPDPCGGSSHTYGSAETTSGGGGDDHEDDGGITCPPGCDITIGGVGDDAEFANQVAYVDITNATPGYWCKIKGWVSNLGSIPFNIVGINAILDSENDEGISFYDLNGGQPGVCKLIDSDGHETWERQVDPGGEGIVYCKVVVDQGEKTCTSWHYGTCKEWSYTGGAKYGWTYHFAIEVCVAQWNEDPSPGGESADLDACKHPTSGIHEGPDTPVLPTPGPTT